MSASYIILKENHEKQSTTASNIDTNTTELQDKNQTQTVLGQASTKTLLVETLNFDIYDFMLIVALLFLAQVFLRLLEKAMKKLLGTIRIYKQKKKVLQSQSLNAGEAHEPKGLDTPSSVLQKDHQ